jgi:DNA-binding MarR family transcriptional regulator
MADVKQVLPDLVTALFGRIRPELANAPMEGLRFSHVRVLSAVPEEGASVTLLAERIAMTKQGCGQFVDQLVASGHLRTVPDPGDRRVRLVQRTEHGERTLEGIRAAVREMEERFAQEVGPRRYATFRRVLEELASDTDG